MAVSIPEKFRDLFAKKAFAHLGTLMADGTPQVTPVWCDFDGTYIRVNSAKGRVKDRNMRRNRKVALSVMDPENPYRYLAVRGEIQEITEDGADDHIDSLAKKYLGQDKYPYRQPGEVRVTYKIRPEYGVSPLKLDILYDPVKSELFYLSAPLDQRHKRVQGISSRPDVKASGRLDRGKRFNAASAATL
jgi:PPOX class probable F420-dependent enzyme